MPGSWVLSLSSCTVFSEAFHPLWRFALCAENSQTCTSSSAFSTKLFAALIASWTSYWLLKCLKWLPTLALHTEASVPPPAATPLQGSLTRLRNSLSRVLSRQPQRLLSVCLPFPHFWVITVSSRKSAHLSYTRGPQASLPVTVTWRAC